MGVEGRVDMWETVLLFPAIVFSYATTLPYSNVLYPLFLSLAFATQLLDLIWTEDHVVDAVVFFLELIPVLGLFGLVTTTTYNTALLTLAFIVQLYDDYKSIGE